MAEITDPALLAQLETPQSQINKGSGGGNGGAQGGGYSVAERSAARGKIAAARMLRRQLGTVENLYNRQLKGVGPIQSLSEYNPFSQGNAQFDAAANSLLPIMRQMMRVPGSGADSDKELEVLRNLIPQRTAFDGSNEQRLSQLRQMIDDVETEYGPIAGIQPKTQGRAPKQQSPKASGIKFLGFE